MLTKGIVRRVADLLEEREAFDTALQDIAKPLKGSAAEAAYYRRETAIAALATRDALLAECREVIEMARDRWTFTEDQQFTHTWHDRADWIVPARALLTKLEALDG